MPTQQLATNKHDILINVAASKVWFALTTSDEIPKYMPSAKVVSEWMPGSSIVYTMYDEDGKIQEWNGKSMVWSGVIETLETNKAFCTNYADGSTGVLREVYTLDSLENGVTKLSFDQSLISQEMADNYKEGNEYTLKALKNYLETNSAK